MENDDFSVGIIMLDTHFPRLVGDIGNRLSFPYPVHFETAQAATAASVVTRGEIAKPVIDGFIKAANLLVNKGAKLISTSCGFACAIHEQLQQAISVPLVSSALNMTPALVQHLDEGQTLLTITFDGTVLNQQHFGQFWSPRVVIQGIETGKELYDVIKRDKPSLDFHKAKDDVLQAVQTGLLKHPHSKAILLECTNLPPYRRYIEDRFNLPVYDIFSALDAARSGTLRL